MFAHTLHAQWAERTAKMPRIVAHRKYDLFDERGYIEEGMTPWHGPLELEWRKIVADAVGTDVDHIEVIWLTHNRGSNVPLITLDVIYTVGEHGLVTEVNEAEVRDALSERLRDALIKNPNLPAGEYAAWALPQHGARYKSGIKIPLSDK